MATFDDLNRFFESLRTDFLRERVPAVIAETATEYFKQRFTTKEWDGQTWIPTNHPVNSGTLMLRSGALVNSIRPKIVYWGKLTMQVNTSLLPGFPYMKLTEIQLKNIAPECLS